MLSKRLETFLDRVRVAADKSLAMQHLSRWMTRNLTLAGRPYTFKYHEAHEEIASDQHPSKCVKKCSQVGLTELSLRIAAAIAAVTRSRIIYIFPSARFAEKVSADRFTPIIKEAPALSVIQHDDVKSAAMRKLGNTTIYFQGASGTTQAISIPATHLFIDEEDFCDPVVLGQFNARLRHAEEDPETGLRGVRQRFSTPTIPNYGISKHFDNSDQKYYMVKCSGCNTRQVPDYYSDYVIPGYDGELRVFDKTDLNNPKYLVGEAYVKCQKCGKDLWQDLIDPERRCWVAKYPERRFLSGYQMSPIDVPHYNKVPAIIRQLEDYTLQDHRNFVLGKDHEDANNSFLTSVFDNRTDAYVVTPEEAEFLTIKPTVMGVDIGKTSHILIGKKPDYASKELHIIFAIQISVKEGTLAQQIQKLIDAYGPEVVVLDAGPDFTTPQKLIEDNRYGQILGCEYYRSVPGAYTNIDVKADDGIVKADRSKTLSDTMKRHNKGDIHYPAKCEEVNEIRDHLKATKKITTLTEMGEVVSFPKTGQPDHYAHALNYLCIADHIASDPSIIPRTVGVAPGVTKVRMGQSARSA